MLVKFSGPVTLIGSIYELMEVSAVFAIFTFLVLYFRASLCLIIEIALRKHVLNQACVLSVWRVRLEEKLVTLQLGFDA